jgi:hypothetical protein
MTRLASALDFKVQFKTVSYWILFDECDDFFVPSGV